MRARSFLAVLLSVNLIFLPAGCVTYRLQPPEVPIEPVVFNPLQAQLQKSYFDLFETSGEIAFSPVHIAQMREYLRTAEDYCSGKFETKAREFHGRLREAQAELRGTSGDINDEGRRALHCKIQNLRDLEAQAHALADEMIPIAYENRQAKLNLIENWPEELRRAEEEIESGSYRNRKYSDVSDIGFRDVGTGQEEDIDDGMDVIRRMREMGLMPPEVENAFVLNYVRSIAERIAANSDLQVPVDLTVLNGPEVNAYALPGGFLFIQRGLLEATEDEAQLAGVIAHELAHSASRHGHQLMRRALITDIIYQLAQVAAMVLTAGASSAAIYNAMQYGFYGLGFVLSLNLLGVSREFELEADQLGVQYAWKAGYDTSGFIRFFDKMATTEGYVNGASWFRTHPPFYERMVEAQREILFLPAKAEAAIQTSDFERMKEELPDVLRELEDTEKVIPSLDAEAAPELELDCAPPSPLYEPDQPIEVICGGPGTS